jgi:hypothetical protein
MSEEDRKTLTELSGCNCGVCRANKQNEYAFSIICYEAEKNLADKYMEEWNEWMNAPLGSPKPQENKK